MEEGLEFLATLEAALKQRKTHLEEQGIPRLRSSFHAYQTALKGIIQLLLRKSLIREDPYKHEQKISEVTLPSSDPVLDSEKFEQISLRLSNFETQLDFLNNFYQFSVEFLDLRRLRLLSRLVSYIVWNKLSDASGNVNTKLIAELFTKVRHMGDTLSISVLNDAQNQLIKATDDILALLRELTSYHRERYKLEMRRKLFATIDLDAQTVLTEREEVLRKLKTRFAQLSAAGDKGDGRGIDKRTPYYPELLAEILDEDYSEYAENLRAGIVEKLQVQTEKPVKKEALDFRPMLIEAVRLVGTAGIPLETAIQKLVENATLLEQKKLTLGARFRLWLTKLVRNDIPTRSYEIEITDPETAITHVEKLDFKSYTEKILKRCRVLEGISNKMSATHTKLLEADEEQIYGFLSTNLSDVHTLYTRLPALDNFFKSKLGHDEKTRLKGIKMEIMAIKNAVVKSNQKMHEYVSRKEEEEQLKKLGITDPPAP